MSVLGWGLGKWRAGYRTGLPKLSDEEAALVASVAERFRSESQRKEFAAGEAEREIARLLAAECEEQGVELDSDQEKYICRASCLQTFGLGFLEPLLSDSSLEEIALVGLGRPVFVYVRGDGWKSTDVYVDSAEYFVSLANRLGRNLGRRLTSQQPRLNAVLEDGSRLHASMPPISGCELTIRRFTREPFSPFALRENGTLDARAIALLSLAMQADFTVLLAGNTASGKTSTLNALLSFVPSTDRVLLIEETPEISIPHPHQLRLMPFEEGKIGMTELVRDSLRMRPDRVVVGEVRTPEEARAFVESSLSGQAKGCYATFHAQSSRDALLRLRMMGCPESDLAAIGLIAVQRRLSRYDAKKRKAGEERRLVEIAVSGHGGAPGLVPVFLHGRHLASGTRLLLEKAADGLGLSASEAKRELSARERFFSRPRRDQGFAKSFSEIQSFLFGGGLPG